MDAGAQVKSPSLRRAVSLASLLVFIDAFWINQGVIAGITGVVLLLVGLPRTFLARFATVRRQRLRNLAIYLTAVMFVFVINGANNRIARNRAEALVSAVKAYHSKHQRYPRSLDELVPEFVGRIPPAKYTLAFNEFRYVTSERDTLLLYTSLAPFGRPTYSFTRDRWVYLD